MIDYNQDKLAFSLDDVSMKIPVRLCDLGQGLVRNLYSGLFLYDGTCVAVFI